MKAFIFSLDAFVAFTLALVAIYSLIFFASVPSSYYYLLTQGHYLARDTLYSVSTSDCVRASAGIPGFADCRIAGGSVLDNIVFGNPSYQKDTIINSVGMAVPKQFGYVLEVSADNGRSWAELYDTSSPDTSLDTQQHARAVRKLSVSSQVVAFQYSSTPAKNNPNPYLYTSCMGGITDGSGNILLTCSDFPKYGGYGGGPAGGDIVPATGIRLVRLTIFI